MSSRKNGASSYPWLPAGIARRVPRFSDLKIRTKLIVLHNLFFFILTIGVYFSLIPLFERLADQAHAREVSLLQQLPYNASRLALAQQSYEETVFRARVTLFLIMGAVYGLAVLCSDCSGRPGKGDLEADFIGKLIVGPDAFVVTADGDHAFAEAVRRKLILEISGFPAVRVLAVSEMPKSSPGEWALTCYLPVK